MHRTPLASPPLHFNLAWLKAFAPMADDRISWLCAIVLVCTVASILLVFRTRRQSRISKSLTTTPVTTSPSDLQKDSPLSRESPTVPSKQTIGATDQRQRKPVEPDSKPYSRFAMGVFLLLPCTLLVLIHFQLVTAIADHYRSLEHPLLQTKDSTGLQEVFQVYQPVSPPVPKDADGDSSGCDLEVSLMDHVFGYSYGQPFVGNYTPPVCAFDTVHINFTVTSRGKQYDRLALMYLGDVEVFRTSTAEPTTAGIVWTYIKEMSHYNSLWKQPQSLIFDLGNIINDVYTGSFNATLTAHFSLQNKNTAQTADLILPISARKSASNSASAFSLPTDNTTVSYKIPSSASRAVVSISACGQSEEEFWWSNVFSEDITSFTNTVGELYGYSPFREIQLYIDGVLAGVVWPFPVIFTGGVAPGFWRPIVGTDAFDLRQSEIDISPFLPLFRDGEEHSFEIRVSGLNILPNGTAVLADTVGSYWVVTGNIFLYTDIADEGSEKIDLDSEAVQIIAPNPTFTIARRLTKNETGANDTLEYSVIAERTFTTTSSKHTWSQKLTFSNHGLLNQEGYSQVNKQLTSGKSTITDLNNHQSNKTTFRYPLLVNATYGITDDSLTIDAWMKRGLEIDSSGSSGLSTYTLASGPGPYHLRTSQSGKARYESSGGGSSSRGNTADEYESTANGVSYSRSVRAVNGKVVYDTRPVNKASSASFQSVGSGLGRDSVRSMLGRGPGKIRD
ncbi:unnamed protein product [Penicillium manginii]